MTVTKADETTAEEIVSAANVVTNHGYYEIDIDAVVKVLAKHREDAERPYREALAQVRAAVFEVLRRHGVSEQCFAEVAAATHALGCTDAMLALKKVLEKCQAECQRNA